MMMCLIIGDFLDSMKGSTLKSEIEHQKSFFLVKKRLKNSNIQMCNIPERVELAGASFTDSKYLQKQLATLKKNLNFYMPKTTDFRKYCKRGAWAA